MSKVKLGIVGLGRLGKQHAENMAYQLPGAELKAVCSLVERELDEAQRALGIQHGYLDYMEMIKDTELDGVVIASSSGEHTWQIEAALNAGLHVFCEKPLGITSKAP